MHGIKKGHMGPLEEQQELDGIASSLSGSFPEDWRAAIYHVRIMGRYANELIEVELGTGEIIRAELPPDSGMKCMRLRAGMYKENQGTWFSLRMKLWNTGRYRSEFDYDNPPDFLFEPDLREYLREVRLFPRNEECMPSWLREKIHIAGP